MFTHMYLVRQQVFTAHNKDYELLLFKTGETGDLRLFVSTGGFGVGPTFAVKGDVIADLLKENGEDAGQTLIDHAIDDIKRNEFDIY